jgi:magnesium chelatase subunit D
VKIFPFAAIVGQEQMKRALLICAVDHSVGGILIRGDKGTAKSTAARALAEVMPQLMTVAGCKFNCQPERPTNLCDVCNTASAVASKHSVPFVNLPLGATEDRVIGSLDFERALKEGKKVFQPGILASANRGVLYIDEVNLLPDHLVDLLLDVAATGVNHIEREGLSFSHPARIALIGTMNPEEGDLRPQLLDRFGMMVEVKAPSDSPTRVEVVKRRIAFDQDSDSYRASWREQGRQLTETIDSAQKLLAQVVLSESHLSLISDICCQMSVTSLRADIVMNKVARALAALDQRTRVNVGDIKEAAQLVLPHRMRQKPTDRVGHDEERLDAICNDALRQDSDQLSAPEQFTETDCDAQTNSVTSDQKRLSESSQASEQIFGAKPALQGLKIEMKSQLAAQHSGKRTTVLDAPKGQYVRAVPNPQPSQLAVSETLRHSVLRNGGTLAVSSLDLHEKIRSSKNGSLIIFVVDSSGSMAALRQMELVKGAAISLLADVYRRRDKVAVISFRGQDAELLVPPTQNVQLVQDRLADLATGGRTPLTAALQMVTELVDGCTGAQPAEPLVIVLCDGKANVSIARDADPLLESLEAANQLAERGVASIVIDTESGYTRFGRAQTLANALAADCIRLDQISVETLILKIRSRFRSRSGKVLSTSPKGPRL